MVEEKLSIGSLLIPSMIFHLSPSKEIFFLYQYNIYLKPLFLSHPKPYIKSPLDLRLYQRHRALFIISRLLKNQRRRGIAPFGDYLVVLAYIPIKDGEKDFSSTIPSRQHPLAMYTDQKKRVAEEEATSKKIGLGIRLLSPSTEDATTAASVKFAHKFDMNIRDKRAMIYFDLIFSGSSSLSKHSELESKRRKIRASSASKILAGEFKRPSWSEATISSKKDCLAL
ncbi:uncharacterized protein LOC107845841 isoform X2 [Capsicum annuum]|uniref:uncharacterized protein LOC107845841 isoform X2 n=1 Tax=Capsicum annuum TaxID=4072 RepID=UPI001FB11CAF|nr:uncharacterized protein LOC107845841 isoform X2 [Capsicum annuum]